MPHEDSIDDEEMLAFFRVASFPVVHLTFLNVSQSRENEWDL